MGTAQTSAFPSYLQLVFQTLGEFSKGANRRSSLIAFALLATIYPNTTVATRLTAKCSLYPFGYSLSIRMEADLDPYASVMPLTSLNKCGGDEALPGAPQLVKARWFFASHAARLKAAPF